MYWKLKRNITNSHLCWTLLRLRFSHWLLQFICIWIRNTKRCSIQNIPPSFLFACILLCFWQRRQSMPSSFRTCGTIWNQTLIRWGPAQKKSQSISCTTIKHISNRKIKHNASHEHCYHAKENLDVQSTFISSPVACTCHQRMCTRFRVYVNPCRHRGSDNTSSKQQNRYHRRWLILKF